MKLPSLRNVFRRKPVISKPSGVPGSKVSNNGIINRTGVTKTYATRGAARKAANLTAKPKPLQAANKRTFGQMINSTPKFGSKSPNYRVNNAPKTGERFGNYINRTASPKPLRAEGKRTFGQFLSKPRFGSKAR